MNVAVDQSLSRTFDRIDAGPPIDALELNASIDGVLNRHPTVGLAVGVVRDGSLGFFRGHGLADIASNTPVNENTVFRIGSITKTFTAIAVMQLWEQGLVDLDAPANDYLRAYKLIPARSTHRPATLRHLLTYTAGLPQCVYLSRTFEPVLGEMVKRGRPVPTPARYYRGGVRLVAEPGTTHVYSNHGFVALGQIVEDVSGEPLHRYLRDHLFEPLGMDRTDLVRSDRVGDRRATGYAVRRRGARPVVDRDLITAAGGGAYSSALDVARYVAALLGRGANEHGSILEPETLAEMFVAQYQPDPHLAGVGLAFYRREVGGHLFIEKSGLVPGFGSQMAIAPSDGVGVVAFTNGARGAHGWLGAETAGILGKVLGIPVNVIRTDVPEHPEVWNDLCGWYSLRGSWRDVDKWVVAGASVFVRGDRLMLRPQTPVPASRAFPLYPDEEADPYVFRVDLSQLGIGPVRLVFSAERGAPATAFHLEMEPLVSFDRQARVKDPRRWAAGALGAAAAATAAHAVRRHRRQRHATAPR